MTTLVSACQWARLPLVDKGADNHEVSPHAIGPSSHDNKIVCRDNHKVSPHATGPSSPDSRIVCTDNHKVSLYATRPSSHVSPHAIGPSSHDIRWETFSRSRPEDTNISGKGADDHIGLWVSTGSLSSS